MNRKIEESEKLKKMLSHMYDRGFADGEMMAKARIENGIKKAIMTPEKILRNLDHGYTMTHQEQAEAAAYIRQLQQAVLSEREACAKLCEEVGEKAKDNDGYTIGGYACAKEIRARGEK